MLYAASREEFIRLMESEGYGVRWTENRKNITYTTPGGMKARDCRLHERKYLKEVMEDEFRIRAEFLAGSVPEPQRSGHTRAGRDARRSGPMVGGYGGADEPAAEYHRESAGVSQPDRDRAWDAEREYTAGGDTADASEAGETDGSSTRTGWEKERATFLAMALEPAKASLLQGTVVAPTDWDSLVRSVVQLGRSVERAEDPAPVIVTGHTDRRQREKEREKRLALGHKVDDHEDRPNWQQTM